MNQHYDDAGGAGTAMVASQPMNIATLEPFAIRQQPTRVMKKLVYRGETHAFQEQIKVRLFSDVIRNTVALSAICDQAAAVVPSSEPLCREITRTYALSSVDRLGRVW